MPKPKGKFYRVMVRPTLLYGEKCSPIKNVHVQKMKVAEIRMFKWIYGHTRREMIRNEVIWSKAGGLHDRINQGSEDEIIRACEEVCGYASKEV